MVLMLYTNPSEFVCVFDNARACVWVCEWIFVCVAHPQTSVRCSSNLTFCFLIQQYRPICLHVFINAVLSFMCGILSQERQRVFIRFSFLAIFWVHCWLQYTWIDRNLFRKIALWKAKKSEILVFYGYNDHTKQFSLFWKENQWYLDKSVLNKVVHCGNFATFTCVCCAHVKTKLCSTNPTRTTIFNNNI